MLSSIFTYSFATALFIPVVLFAEPQSRSAYQVCIEAGQEIFDTIVESINS